MENWQSENLQFLVFLLLTIWLFQKGSPESKEEDELERESESEQLIGEHAKRSSPGPAKAGGWRAALYGNSAADRDGPDLPRHLVRPVGHRPDEIQPRIARPPRGGGQLAVLRRRPPVLGNDPAELAAQVPAVGSFAVYLRQRGSPESKPVGAAHTDTGAEG